jgi:TetR/AcrR family transcriptional repressor of bet genes
MPLGQIMCAAVFADSAGTSRKASKAVRRHQLIEATIDTLAKKGYAELTLADVAKTAGLSVGIVNFHFETKEKLLVETLKSLAEDYRNNWQRALRDAGPAPAQKLASLWAADFNEQICSPRSLAAWCAFWAEAQSRPTYQEHCSSNDAEYSAVTHQLCSAIIEEGGYPYDPLHIARALDALLEGLWLDLMTMEKPYTRKEALNTVFATLNAIFPQHFTASGTVMS